MRAFISNIAGRVTDEMPEFDRYEVTFNGVSLLVSGGKCRKYKGYPYTKVEIKSAVNINSEMHKSKKVSKDIHHTGSLCTIHHYEFGKSVIIEFKSKNEVYINGERVDCDAFDMVFRPADMLQFITVDKC